MWSTVVQEGLFEVFSLYSSLCSKCLVEMDNSKVRYAPHFTLLLPSHYTHTHTCTPTCTPTHMHTHTPIPGGQRPVNPQVREEEQRLVRIFMTIAVLVVILIVFA